MQNQSRSTFVMISMGAAALTLAAAGQHLRSAAAQGTTPSVQRIVAAMRDQEKPGQSIRVRYAIKTSGTTRTATRVDVQQIATRCYVRTPDLLYLEERVTNHTDPSVDTSGLHLVDSTETTLYDRVSGEYRRLLKFDDGSPSEGKVTHDPKHLGSMTTVESVVSYFATASLYWMVSSGIVMEDRETIDGHRCWGVCLDVGSGVQRHVIWVDPDIGYCPRRIDLIIKSVLRMRRTMRDYKEIGNGVWFPGAVVLETYDKSGRLELGSTIMVEDVKLVPITPENTPQVVFPAGAAVDSDSEPQGKS